ncbi:MAG: hypothetical protein Q8K98_04245 [Bacteroidota bacterium]|nr:hypothetical protein [Bacteroidota bacterium]
MYFLKFVFMNCFEFRPACQSEAAGRYSVDDPTRRDLGIEFL